MITIRRLRPTVLIVDCSAFVSLRAASSDPFAVLAAAHAVTVPAKPEDPLPEEIVWMPAGEHTISAFAADGKGWQGTVKCDEAGARAVAAQLDAILAKGGRVFLDKDHKDEEATAWVLAFRWDPVRGIVAKVKWSALGEQLLRGSVYYSFSPAFLLNKKSGGVAGFPPGHAAGGLVNAPAFGAAMPALIAAKYLSTASGGSPDNSNAMNKELIIQILAALAVQVPADASEEQAVALFASNKDRLIEAAKTNASLKQQLDTVELQAKQKREADERELIALRARESQRKKDDAKKAVDAAVARGALPPKDEAIQAKWRGLIEAEPANIELLAALPGNPLLAGAITSPGNGVVVEVNAKLLEHIKGYQAEKVPLERGRIFARHIEPEIVKLGNEVLHLMAANSLGTLSGQIILQRYLSLLKFRFPWLSRISTNFSDAGGQFGQTVQTRLRSVPTVRDYDATTGYTTRSDATTTDVPVVINKHKYCAIEFGVESLASTARDLFGEQAEPQLYAMGYQFVTDLLAVIVEGASAFGTAGSQSTEIANAAAFNSGTLDTVASKLDLRKVGPMGRFALLDATLWPQLRADTRLVYLAGFQDRGLIERYDTMPPVSGFDVFNAPFLPTPVVDTTKAMHGFCGTSESLACAARVPTDYTQALPGASNGNVTVIQEPDSKLSMALVQYVNHDLGSAIQRVALMYGASVGNKLTGQLIAY